MKRRGGFFDVAGKQAELAEVEKLAEDPTLWNDQERAQELMKRKSTLEAAVASVNVVGEMLEEAELLLSLAEEEGDDESAKESEAKVAEVEAALRALEVKRMLSGEMDTHNAIVSINPGAGGTEAQDWAEMLLRMYLRWAEKRGLDTEIIEYTAGDEAGLKSVTFTLTGEYAFGYMKAEVGVHRLVRISPYDAAKRRHTSFSSVIVYPEITEDIEVEVNESDLRIDTYRASGAGGQHVNKTDSAVRLTHEPTGIVVQCQNQRSQHKNKATAMKILKARLYELKRKEEEEKLGDMHKDKKDIAWGSQIRSYVMQPYRMIKDHRTGIEVGDVDRIMNGDLDGFIEGYLVRAAG